MSVCWRILATLALLAGPATAAEYSAPTPLATSTSPGTVPNLGGTGGAVQAGGAVDTNTRLGRQLAAAAQDTLNVLDTAPPAAIAANAAGCPTAAGDGVTDDWWAVQCRVNYLSTIGGGTVLFPRGYTYRRSQAVRVQSNIIQDAHGAAILCTGNPLTTYPSGVDPTGAYVTYLTGYPSDGCNQFGSSDTMTVNALPVQPISGAVAPGATSVTFANPGAASGFVVGDIVLVESTVRFEVTAGSVTTEKPAFLEEEPVTAVNAAANTISFPKGVSQAISSAEVKKLTNTGLTWSINGGNTNVPLWASYRAQVIGGDWTTTHLNAGFGVDGACIACTWDIHSFTGAYGLGASNLIADSYIHATIEQLTLDVLESAYGSSGNEYRFDRVEVNNPIVPYAGGPTNLPRMIEFDEGAHNNSFWCGLCITYVGEAANVLTIGGSIATPGTDSVTGTLLVNGATITVTYTTKAGDTVASVATGLAAAVNANTALSAAGITAAVTGNAVLFANATAATPWTITSSSAVGNLAVSVQVYAPIQFNAAWQNDVTIDKLLGSPVSSYIALFTGLTIDGNAPATSYNNLRLGTVGIANAYGDVRMDTTGTAYNTVEGGVFTGSVMQPKALWYASGVGSFNAMRHVKALGATATTGCDQADMSNVLEDVYVTAPPTVVLGGSGSTQIENAVSCTRKRVADSYYLNLMRAQADWDQGSSVTSAGQRFIGTTVPAASIADYDNWIIRTHVTLSGSAGTKTITAAFAGCSVANTIPADATGAEIIWRFTAHTATAITGRGWVVTEGSVTAPGQATSCNATVANPNVATSAQITYAATTGSDTERVDLASMRPWSPLYDNTLQVQ